ncbi:hypothetical protein [Donghicola mangrovi]|uniref:Uncharacterized protein n=1 Tax=Donghicola mangrovi TaxID=2729614 RepID=A0A850Q833_9RHOB|nr:hypothetical protein [Donghicola mangrovi]NVO24382.1 hypothetical protein [Donghicola mangrovi]
MILLFRGNWVGLALGRDLRHRMSGWLQTVAAVHHFNHDTGHATKPPKLVDVAEHLGLCGVMNLPD